PRPGRMIEPEIRVGRSGAGSGTLREASMETAVRTTVDEVLGRVAELEPRIRAASAEAEIERRLSAHVAEALRDAGCYHLFRPWSRGGLELDPVSAFQVIEELSRIDSAAGWNVAQANNAEPFGAWLSDETT